MGKMEKEIRQVPMLAISPDGSQPRKEFDDEELQELAQSIRRNGLLNPITVKAKVAGNYIIIAGERRYRAHEMLGAEIIECIVYTGGNGKELQLVENINRKDLNCMEIAEAYQSYLDSGKTIEELSQVVGKPRSTISWILNLGKCRPEIQHLVRRNQISLVVAISLSKLTNNGQLRALRTMQMTKLNVAECRILCEQISAEENRPDMFAEEPRLTNEELKSRKRVQNAIDHACQALQEVARMENENPGITSQAVADKLDITQEKVDLLYSMVGQFRRSLGQRRVAGLC